MREGRNKNTELQWRHWVKARKKRNSCPATESHFAFSIEACVSYSKPKQGENTRSTRELYCTDPSPGSVLVPRCSRTASRWQSNGFDFWLDTRLGGEKERGKSKATEYSRVRNKSVQAKDSRLLWTDSWIRVISGRTAGQNHHPGVPTFSLLSAQGLKSISLFLQTPALQLAPKRGFCTASLSDSAVAFCRHCSGASPPPPLLTLPRSARTVPL